MATSPSSGTISLVGSGSIRLTFPSGIDNLTITVSTPPGTPGSSSPYVESVEWTQTKVRLSWWSRTYWQVNVTWDVVIPHNLTYQYQT